MTDSYTVARRLWVPGFFAVDPGLPADITGAYTVQNPPCQSHGSEYVLTYALPAVFPKT